MMHTSKLKRRLLFLLATTFLTIIAIGWYIHSESQPSFKKPHESITSKNITQIQLLAKLDSPTNGSGKVEFSDNSQIIMIGNAEGATVWDSSGTRLGCFKTIVDCHNNCDDYESNFSLSPDGTLLVSSYSIPLQSDMQLWNVETGKLLKSFGPDKGRYTLDFSPDSSLILYDYKGKGYIYEIATDKETLLENETIGQMAFDPNSNDVFYVTFFPDSRKLRKWDARTKSVKTLIDQLSEPIAFALSPNDALLVAIQDGTRIVLWDITANTKVYVSEVSPDVYWNIEFSSDGRLLISKSTTRVIIWDILSQTESLTVNGNSYTDVFDSIVGVSSDLVAYYQSPDIISIWNLKTRQEAASLKSRSLKPPLAFSPDGTLLVSYSGHVWGIP